MLSCRQFAENLQMILLQNIKIDPIIQILTNSELNQVLVPGDSVKGVTKR